MPSRIEDGPLSGGTANFGRIVRIDDTVHRPVGVHTPAVHALLEHLTATGFHRTPQVIGRDANDEIETDLNPADVIFRDGHPVVMIDFDLAVPGCAAFDLDVTACFWVPLLDARDIDDNARRGHPAFGRLWQRAMGVRRRASTWLTTHTDELLVASR